MSCEKLSIKHRNLLVLKKQVDLNLGNGTSRLVCHIIPRMCFSSAGAIQKKNTRTVETITVASFTCSRVVGYILVIPG